MKRKERNDKRKIKTIYLTFTHIVHVIRISQLLRRTPVCIRHTQSDLWDTTHHFRLLTTITSDRPKFYSYESFTGSVFPFADAKLTLFDLYSFSFRTIRLSAIRIRKRMSISFTCDESDLINSNQSKYANSASLSSIFYSLACGARNENNDKNWLNDRICFIIAKLDWWVPLHAPSIKAW